MKIIFYIAFAFWGLIGFIHYIPLLIRVISAYCFSIVYNMVTNNPKEIQENREGLATAVNFYFDGFKAIKSTFNQSKTNDDKVYIFQNKQEFKIYQFLMSFLWTISFWSIIIVPIFSKKIKEYIKTSNSNSEQLVREAENRIKVGDTATAIELYNKAIEKDKYNPRYYYLRGDIYIKKQEFSKAVKDLSSSWSLDTSKFGKDSQLPFKIGVLYINLNQYNDALNYFNEVIRISPSFSAAYVFRGTCYENNNNLDLALVDYDRAIAYNYQNGNAHCKKGILLAKKGIIHDACISFEDAINNGDEEAKKYKNQYCK